MATSRGSIASNRSSVVPFSAVDVPRKVSFEGQAHRSRRCSLEAKFSPKATDAPASRPGMSAEHPIRLEVGQAVDISEQIRRLERNWNNDDPATSTPDQEAEIAECSGRQDPAESRMFIEEKWRTLSRQSSGSLRRRTRARRKRFSTISRAGHREQAKSSDQKLGQRAPWKPRKKQSGADTQTAEAADALLLDTLSRQMNPGYDGREFASALANVFGEWVYDALLSRETELELGRIVQLGLAAEKQLKEPHSSASTDMPTEENPDDFDVSIDSLEKRLKNGEAAQMILLRSNLKLVSSIAKNFEGKGLEAADLIIDGVTGLERAIQLYDPRKGLKFSTYAYMWIRQAMGTSIIENGRVVRLPSHVVEMMAQIARERQHLAATQHNGVPTDQQIARSLGVAVEKVALYTQLSRSHASLEDPGDSNALGGTQAEEDCLADVIQDYNPTADELVTQAEGQWLMQKDIDSVLEGLSIRERNILRFRYGMQTERLSLKELSLRYGISIERVRQIGEIALAKLQLRQACQGKPQEGRTKHVPYLKPENYSLGIVE